MSLLGNYGILTGSADERKQYEGRSRLRPYFTVLYYKRDVSVVTNSNHRHDGRVSHWGVYRTLALLLFSHRPG